MIIQLKCEIKNTPEMNGGFIKFVVSEETRFGITYYNVFVKNKIKKNLLHLQRAYKHGMTLFISGEIITTIENSKTIRNIFADSINILYYYAYYKR